MKRVYWRPRTVSQAVVALVAVLAIVGMGAVEFFRTPTKQPHYDRKIKAVEREIEAAKIIKETRISYGLEIDPEVDLSESGLIGAQMTSITTVPGHLPAKQLSTNPNFAAVLYDMLLEAGVEEGDLVAVGCSGSFPALNLAVYAAMEEMKVNPVIISSAGASQFGANFPELLWIDMEAKIYDAGLIHYRSVACSVGGREDAGLNLPPEGQEVVQKAIERNKLKSIDTEDFLESIDTRMKIYDQHSRGNEYKCYINVGGGTVSVGRSVGKKLYHPGLNMKPSTRALTIDSVMSRFARRGTPIIHLVQIEQLAQEYGLEAPQGPEPAIGQGTVFLQDERNRWLALGVLIALLISLRALVLTDLGFRLFKGRPGKKATGEPEPMV